MDLAIGDMMAGTQADPVQGSSPNSGYAPTYYPGTASPADAQRVDGGRRTGAWQHRHRARAREAREDYRHRDGDHDGKPLAGAMIMLMPAMRDVMLFMPGATSRTWRDGQFTLVASCPGSPRFRCARRAPCSPRAWAETMVFSMATDGVLVLPRPDRRRVKKPSSRRLPVSSRGRGVRPASWSSRHTGHGPSDIWCSPAARRAGQPDERPRDRALSRP